MVRTIADIRKNVRLCDPKTSLHKSATGLKTASLDLSAAGLGVKTGKTSGQLVFG